MLFLVLLTCARIYYAHKYNIYIYFDNTDHMDIIGVPAVQDRSQHIGTLRLSSTDDNCPLNCQSLAEGLTTP